MATLKQTQEKYDERSAVLAEVFDKAKNDAGEYDFKDLDHPFFGDAKTEGQKLEKVNAANDELEVLVNEIKAKTKAEKGFETMQSQINEPANQVIHPNTPEVKTLGETIVESKRYKEWVDEGCPNGIPFNFKDMLPSDMLGQGLEVKTLISTTAGYAPESIRIGQFVEKVTRPIQLLDIMPAGQTSMETIKYMEETTRTHSAAEMAEAATFPESTYKSTERTSNVKKLGASVQVTDEQLEDVPFMNGYLNNRLTFELRQRLDTQMLTGDGTGNNLTGILNTSGIQTQAKGTDPRPDAFYKAMTLIRVTGRSQPTHILMHPTDWEKIRLLRTADGVYIWGAPQEPGQERMWGLPVVLTDIGSAGTGYVGSFQPVHISMFERRGVDVQVGYSGTQFVEGKRTIRADMRMALVVFRPAAFATVTGL